MKTIRELREERHWTQLQLANMLKVTPVTVYNWERGKYEPSASMFRQIALPDAFLDAGALPTLHDRYGISAAAVGKAIKQWLGCSGDRAVT